MLLRVLCAAALCLLLAGASPVAVEQVFVKLECHSPLGGGVTGSGTFISNRMILTASHVTEGRYCVVNGRLAPTLYENKKLDVAVVMATEPGPAYVPMSCAKPRKGQTYKAIGYPKGNGPAVRYFISTGDKWAIPPFGGMDMFLGEATPGMSGSALMDKAGRIVGILNAGNEVVMLSRVSADLWMCR